MREVVLFIAMSLDGYIADKRGGVHWLTGQVPDVQMPDTYGKFIRNVDTVIMGRNTYEQIVTELSPAEWVYQDLTSYVLTHRRDDPKTNHTFMIQSELVDLIQKLKKQPGKHIWICGGADIVRQCMEADLIDTYYISVIPTILGDGIGLFGRPEKELKLELMETQVYNGIVDLVYRRR